MSKDFRGAPPTLESALFHRIDPKRNMHAASIVSMCYRG